MSFEIWASLGGAAVALLLGLYVLRANPRGRANRLLFIVTLLHLGLSLSFSMDVASGDPLTWGRYTYAFIYPILSLLAHFTLEFPRAKGTIDRASLPGSFRWLPVRLFNWDRFLLASPRTKLIFIYGPMALLSVLVVVQPHAFGLEVERGFTGRPSLNFGRATPGFWAIVGLVAVYVGYSLTNFIAQYALATRSARRQIQMVVLGLLFSLLLTGIDLATMIRLGQFNFVPPILLVGYAIVRYRLLLTPVAEEPVSAPPKYTLERGFSYLVKENKPVLGLELLADAVTHGAQGLCFTRTPPARIRQQYGLQRTPIVWVGEQPPSPDIPSAGGDDEIAYVSAKFLKESSNGAICFDSFVYLAQSTDFRRALKLLYHLKELVARSNGRLFLSLNPESIQKQELAILANELEVLGPEAPKGSR